MPRLVRLSQVSRNALLTLPVQVHETAPFTSLAKPLSDCTAAIVTTAALHLRDDQPFVGADPSYRVIPATSTQGDVLQSHLSIGFDRAPALRDWNVVFPIDRLRELVARGEIGSLGPNMYSFMGAQRDPGPIERETAPEVARRLRAEAVDVVLLTPT